jgi:hypothetical protein
VDKRTTPEIDVHDHSMVGALKEDGGWRPDPVVSNTDEEHQKSELKSLYRSGREEPVVVCNKDKPCGGGKERCDESPLVR